MNRCWPLLLSLGIAWAAATVPAQAQIQLQWIGYTQLQSQLGGATPTGAGVTVAQVEVSSLAPDALDYMPDTSQFSPGQNIQPMSGTPATVNGHATAVGLRFYGTLSAAPGITAVHAYSVLNYVTQPNPNPPPATIVVPDSGWLIDYLHVEDTSQAPAVSTARIANHSWVATGAPDELVDVLRRADFVVERDDYIQVAALAPFPAGLFKSSYNAVTVGLTSGGHDLTPSVATGIYTAGRTRPDLVAPESFTSYATPLVSGVAAMLVQAGSDPDAPGVIQNATTSETIKALLMAGADRITNNAGGPNITSYTRTTANGLDAVFGAGQVNAFNSYNILAAGEQGVDAGLDLATGWDYVDDFAGGMDQNSIPNTNSYSFEVDEHSILKAALVWNVLIAEDWEAPLSPDILNNLELRLFDITANEVAQESFSTLDNTENLWAFLYADHTYRLDVFAAGGAALTNQDYAIAWQVTPVPEPTGILLAATALGGLLYLRRRKAA